MPLEDAPLVAFPVPLPRETSPLLANCLISVLHFYLPFTHLARSVRDAVLFIVQEESERERGQVRDG